MVLLDYNKHKSNYVIHGSYKNYIKWSSRVLQVLFVTILIISLFAFGRATQAVTSSTSTVPNYIERSWYVGGNNGGVAVDAADNVYVTLGLGGVAVFDRNTASTADPTNPTLLKTWTGFGAGDITIDENGMVYVTDDNTVKQFDSQEPSGEPTILKTWTGFNFPWGIDIDNDGDIVVANYGGGGTYRMFNRSAEEGAVSTTVWSGVNDAWVVALDDEGTVYAGGYGGSLSKFSKTENAGTPTAMTTWTNTGGNYLNGLHWADGYVYISPSNLTGVGSVQRFPSHTPAGDIGAARVVLGSGQYPYSIATDTAGNVYGNLYGNSSVVKYIIPQNLAELTIPGTADLLYIALPDGTHITDHSVEPAMVTDEMYEYPLGLVSFTFNTTSGSTVPVQISFQTDLSPEEVIPRKYNAASETYEDLPDAEVTATTFEGQPALLLEYDITDGGILDEDGEQNGVIVDPVALGVLAASDPGDGSGDNGGTDNNLSTGTGNDANSGILASTGQPAARYILMAALLIFGGLTVVSYQYVFRKS